MNLIEELEEFVKKTTDGREVKRALAVKMQLKGKSYRDIQELLQVSQSFISKWKNRVIFEGVESLRVQYKGGKGLLSTPEKEKVVNWLRGQKRWDLEKLQRYLEREYRVIFNSPQSYYNLFKETQISWKKMQKNNPRKEPDLVVEVQEEIKKKSRIGEKK